MTFAPAGCQSSTSTCQSDRFKTAWCRCALQRRSLIASPRPMLGINCTLDRAREPQASSDPHGLRTEIGSCFLEDRHAGLRLNSATCSDRPRAAVQAPKESNAHLRRQLRQRSVSIVEFRSIMGCQHARRCRALLDAYVRLLGQKSRPRQGPVRFPRVMMPPGLQQSRCVPSVRPTMVDSIPIGRKRPASITKLKEDPRSATTSVRTRRTYLAGPVGARRSQGFSRLLPKESA